MTLIQKLISTQKLVKHKIPSRNFTPDGCNSFWFVFVMEVLICRSVYFRSGKGDVCHSFIFRYFYVDGNKRVNKECYLIRYNKIYNFSKKLSFSSIGHDS